MNYHKEPSVGVCIELSVGDKVEAWYEGRLSHHGPVTEMAPAVGVFWIMDFLGGGRKVLDLVDFHIVRLTRNLETPAKAA